MGSDKARVRTQLGVSACPLFTATHAAHHAPGHGLYFSDDLVTIVTSKKKDLTVLQRQRISSVTHFTGSSIMSCDKLKAYIINLEVTPKYMKLGLMKGEKKKKSNKKKKRGHILSGSKRRKQSV